MSDTVTLFRPVGLAELRVLARVLASSGADFALEIAANRKLVLIDHGFWSACPPKDQGLSESDARGVLDALAKHWSFENADLPLPSGVLVPRRS